MTDKTLTEIAFGRILDRIARADHDVRQEVILTLSGIGRMRSAATRWSAAKKVVRLLFPELVIPKTKGNRKAAL